MRETSVVQQRLAEKGFQDLQKVYIYNPPHLIGHKTPSSWIPSMYFFCKLNFLSPRLDNHHLCSSKCDTYSGQEERYARQIAGISGADPLTAATTIDRATATLLLRQFQMQQQCPK